MRRSWPLFAFPLVLWFVATLFFLGDTGRWNDDYTHDLRNPVTRQGWAGPLAMQSGTAFRPLYYAIVPPLLTNVGEQMWIAHAITAASHGLVCILVYRLARTLGLGWRAASTAAIGCLVFPPHWQVPLWPSALPTSLATAAALWLSLIVRRSTTRDRSRWVSPLCAAIALAIPCLNEQPAACVPAALVLHFGTSREKPLWRRVIPLAFAGVGIASYLLWFWWTVPPGQRGGTATLLPLDRYPIKAAELACTVADYLSFAEMRHGPFIEAWRVALDHSLAAIGAAVAIAITGLAWIRQWTRSETPPSQGAPATETETENQTPAWIPIAFGIAWFLSSWLPVLVIRGQGVESRLCYPGWPGAMLAVAVLLDALEPRIRHGTGRTAALATLATAIATLAVAGATMYVGIQSAMRERWRQDQREGERLREFCSTAHAGSIILPLAVHNLATHTGIGTFDAMIPGALRKPWASSSYLPSALRRDDLASGWYGDPDHWTPIIHPGPDGRSLLYDNPKINIEKLSIPFPHDGAGSTILPIDRVIPFVIDRGGRVRLVERVEFQSPDGSAIAMDVPQVNALHAASPDDLSVVRFGPPAEGRARNATIEPSRRH